MKRFLLMLTAALICAAGYCQDIIITKESEKIEATVLEVNIDDIKYRRADNPDGPAYTMKKADIASIIYGNGSVEVFDNAQAAGATMQQSVTAGYGKIAKDGSTYYHNGLIISETQVKKMMAAVSPEAYNKFHKGESFNKTFIGMLTCGLTFFCLGDIFIAVSDGYGTLTDVGLAFVGTGSAISLASIPFGCLAPKRKRQAVDIYNRALAGERAEIRSDKPHFDLGLTGNGITLAYKF